MFTRLGYLLILTIVAAAGVAIFFVLRADEATSHPPLELADVVNHAKLGLVDSIEADGRSLVVEFDPDFDTEAAFGTDSHTFESTLPENTNINDVLRFAGVEPNAPGGVRVRTQ